MNCLDCCHRRQPKLAKALACTILITTTHILSLVSLCLLWRPTGFFVFFSILSVFYFRGGKSEPFTVRCTFMAISLHSIYGEI